jgi:NadR type nicotinamide-nucleotide adenylyltransferase
MYSNGVVIGKFLPPHRGHKFLIETAAAQVSHLTVLLCGRTDDPIPPELRLEWLQEIHPDVTVHLVEDDHYDPHDSRFWAAKTIEWLGCAPDVVFTSEDYGEAYARFLGCAHVSVDRARATVPCSGTQIRANPLGNLAYLEPCVRAFFVLRICVVGAESTGTTTMAQALALHYETVWVPEYGRDYWVGKVAREGAESPWRTEEFVHIAQTQNAWEDRLAREANRLLICDTDAFATSIWHERYVGTRSPEVLALSARRHHDLYLLTGDEIPFVQDGTRDGEHLRHWMHQRFQEELEARDLPYLLLTGSHEARLQQAVAAIDALLASSPKTTRYADNDARTAD